MKESHFWYNKRQRNGIFFLLLIIVLVQVVYVYADFSVEDEITESQAQEMLKFEKQLDALYLAKLETKKPTIFPFNPSFLTDFKGAQLGLSTQEIDRVLQHRALGKYINSNAEFQEISKVSDSLLAVISPFFTYPDWVGEQKKQKKQVSGQIKVAATSEITTHGDLNQVSAEELRKINGVGKVLSERIVKFRKSIQGFVFEDQLAEVYGLQPDVVKKILLKYPIVEKPVVEKLNVNTATFKEVLKLPYIDYQLTQRIFNYREEVAEIQSLEELKNIEGFPLDLFDRIAVYLDAQ